MRSGRMRRIGIDGICLLIVQAVLCGKGVTGRARLQPCRQMLVRGASAPEVGFSSHRYWCGQRKQTSAAEAFTFSAAGGTTESRALPEFQSLVNRTTYTTAAISTHPQVSLTPRRDCLPTRGTQAWPSPMAPFRMLATFCSGRNPARARSSPQEIRPRPGPSCACPCQN